MGHEQAHWLDDYCQRTCQSRADVFRQASGLIQDRDAMQQWGKQAQKKQADKSRKKQDKSREQEKIDAAQFA
jgi:hypothetical protein